jgi:Flp pilus assembly protein TadD
MGVRRIPVLIVATACLASLGACTSSPKLSDSWSAQGGGAPGIAGAEVTGSVAHPATAGVRANSGDDLDAARKYFAGKNYGLAAQSFSSAAAKHPGDVKAWIGLATSYDHLRRFDLADHAYDEAIRLAGQTAEILNDEGYSYMLRGDYARAQKSLKAAEAKNPADPYVQANLELLQQSYFQRQAVQ